MFTIIEKVNLNKIAFTKMIDTNKNIINIKILTTMKYYNKNYMLIKILSDYPFINNYNERGYKYRDNEKIFCSYNKINNQINLDVVYDADTINDLKIIAKYNEIRRIEINYIKNELDKLIFMLDDAKIPFSRCLLDEDGNKKSYDSSSCIYLYNNNYKLLCSCGFSDNMDFYREPNDNYADELLELNGGLTKYESTKYSCLYGVNAHEAFKRLKYCYENNTDIYEE